MKKVIAINGSPRKKGNTATLLRHALKGAVELGAETEMINLYDLNYKGCISCYACKRKDNKYVGKCAMKDELSPILEKIIQSDVLLLGSPIYCHNITGAMQSLLERLIYMNLSYDKESFCNFTGRINVGFIYTMGAPQRTMFQSGYDIMFKSRASALSSFLRGKSEYMTSNDTLLFDDYSKYAASVFDEDHKKKVYVEQFPVDCRNAFEMGKRLLAE